jgi:hypothetical protein
MEDEGGDAALAGTATGAGDVEEDEVVRTVEAVEAVGDLTATGSALVCVAVADVADDCLSVCA